MSFEEVEFLWLEFKLETRFGFLPDACLGTQFFFFTFELNLTLFLHIQCKLNHFE